MTRILCITSALSMLWLSGCASSQPQTDAPSAAPEQTASASQPQRELPLGEVPQGDVPIRMDQAIVLMNDLESHLPPGPDHPLRNPETLDHVEAILKRDQTSLFAPAIEVVQRHKGLRARALEAQIQLAWGESYTVVMEVLLQLSRHVDGKMMTIDNRLRPEPGDDEKLARLEKLSERLSRAIELFQLMSLNHVSKGSELAKQVITNYPDNYLGYRLEADHQRMMRKWEDFDQMLRKLKALKPDSNGLVFLEGAAALQRDANPQVAAQYYRTALDNDPEFIRAQAHLVLSQSTLEGLQHELKRLEALNPHHQLVHWAMPALEYTYAESR